LTLESYVLGKYVQYVPPGKIVDFITGKLRRETPEEHVRQRIARSLVEEYGYSRTEDIAVDFRLTVGNKQHYYPTDLAIFYDKSSHRQENIYILVETKNEAVKENDPENGIDQLKFYMASCLNCIFGLWSNGKDKVVLRKNTSKEGIVEFVPSVDIPQKGRDISDYDKPSFTQLRPATELKSVFRRCVDYIYGNQGMRKDQGFNELLKIIFCKVQDEKTDNIRFYITTEELNSTTGWIKVKKRLDELFRDVKENYSHIFSDANEEINLKNSVLAFVVSQLQYFWLLRTDTDVKGDAYEELVGENLRGNLGEFFTPRGVCRMAVRILFSTYKKETTPQLKILDPACGTGGFLVSIIDYMRNHFYTQEFPKFRDEDLTQQSVDRLVAEYCNACLYGDDFNESLVRATQMNEVMHGNGSVNLFSENTLKAPGEFASEEARKKIKLEHFDLVFTNPPFGENIPINDRHILENYKLGHIWKQDENKFVMTDDLRAFVPPEQLFVERCIQFLKPNGRMAIVLPDGVLNNPSLKFLRFWILSTTKVLASIDLPRVTFLPSVGAKTSLLFLEKLTSEEVMATQESERIPNYDIFMAVSSKVGHDRRGVPLYKRTPEGEIILKEAERQYVKFLNGKKIRETVRETIPEKDDDLPGITDQFAAWWKEHY
jgi:type I restriction enzyme M protein